MFPGMNPKMIQQAMKKMGMKQEEIDAEEVIIKGKNKTLIIKQPSVQKINMMGQDSFQITGNVHEVQESTEISEDDIKTVMEQAKVSESKAREALENNNGDLAAEIISLKE